jgi:hypothetical protein
MTSMLFGTFQRLFLTTFALLIVVSSSRIAGQGPSLAELARKEEARRKAETRPTKVLTNNDLSAPQPATPATPATTASTSQPAAEQQKAAEAKAAEPKPADERNEEWWRTRMSEAREHLRQNEMFAEALQSRVNALRADFLRRDNPVQRGKIAEDREKAGAELNRVKGEIDKARKQIAEIEEEARKAGVPPGWLR